MSEIAVQPSEGCELFDMTIDDVVVQPPGEGIVDPQSWFQSPGRFELEIGCGKGGFLLHRARTHPEVRLLGIEWASKYFRSCADRMARRSVGNVRVMRTDAQMFVMRNLPPDCVSCLHLYHPDPWPKKRHHKRRLVQPAFAAAAIAALTPGGLWLIQSDHAEYFQHILDVVATFVTRGDVQPIAWNDTGIHAGTEWQGTNFEIKYVREGRRIQRAAFIKRMLPSESGAQPTNIAQGIE